MIKNTEETTMKNTKECAVKGLTKRGQMIADRRKTKCTVKNLTKRLYIYKIGKETVGCQMVDNAKYFPTKTAFRIHRL